MPRPELRKTANRRRPTPIVEGLEGREMLNGTSITKAPAAQVHIAAVMHNAAANMLATQEKLAANKLATQEKLAANKLAMQQRVTANKVAMQEKSELVQFQKQQLAAEKKAIASGPLAKDRIVKAGSASMDLYQVLPPGVSNGADNTTPIAGLYAPLQVETAYGTNLLPPITLANGSTVPNQGQGVTIGIIDEYNDPNIISDANVYSAQYGLPIFNSSGGPTLSVVEDTDLGGTFKNSSTNPNSSSDSSGETSIDVELAHAMAPMANIVLVETVNSSDADLLEGIQDAAKLGASAISLSYGGGDSASEVTPNTTYLATGAASLVAVTVSTGDGSSPSYPATSPNVVAVGGTSLFLASAQGAYGYETAWGGYGTGGYSGGAGGGGPSTVFAAPTFQSANGVTLSTKRTIPDVSLVADPFTAVSVYDSWDTSDWTGYGGTSVASPMFAGVLALAQQERLDAGQPFLSSVQIDTALYQAYTNPTTYYDIFNDVTLGKNADLSSTGKVTVAGYSATSGYDLATGLGSPWADYMVPYLATGIDPGA